LQSQLKRRISKIFSHAKKEKNKTHHHTGDIDRQGKLNEFDKFNMTLKFDSYSDKDKNRQCITNRHDYSAKPH